MLPIILDSKFLIIYSYPLFLGVAIGICYYISKYFFEFKNIKISYNLFFAGLTLTSWVFAKLFFLWFSATQIQSEIYIKESYFWLGGGFVFYGGLIGSIFYLYIYSKFNRNFNFQESYLLIPGGVFAHAAGRVGCFLAGCCYGRLSNLPWSVNLNGVNREPVQLYEAMFLFFLGLFFYKKVKNSKEGIKIIPMYLVSYSMFRFLIEFIRGDELRGQAMGSLSNSQAISIVIIALSSIILFRKMRQELTH